MNRRIKHTRTLISVAIVVACVALCLMTGVRRVSANTFTVTNTGDNGGINPAPGAGTGTLRQAIIDANAFAGADIINFQAGLIGTITLANALPQITQDLTINGPGAGVLTVSGANLYRVFDISSDVIVTISGLTISNGKSDSGGGILNGGTLTVTNNTFSSNSAIFVGGGIYNTVGTLTVTNSTFSGNSAFLGGGIESAGTDPINSVATLTVTNSTFSRNSAANRGGGIESVGTIAVTNSTFSGNSAFLGGGIVFRPDIFLRGTATVTNSTISGNSADFGGGIYVDTSFQLEATLTVTNSTLSSNTATFGGGGILNAGTLTVTNGTFSGNSANRGGGIENVGTLTVTNSTFSGNSAFLGGGISNFGAATSKNSIIGNSPTGGNYAGSEAITAVGVNFSTDNTCAGFTQVTPQQLNLGPLQDNGGPTFTHALLSGSVAIDAVIDCTDLSATPAPVTTDQRGKPRPADGNGSLLCDTGAFEVQPCVITCPVNVTAVSSVACPPSSSTAVTFLPPTVTDNCQAVCSPPSGSILPVGTTTVTCTATDSSGNTATCSFTVTVFNGRLQDDSNPQNVVLFNTTTGDYSLCCGDMRFSGRGLALLKGCVFTLQHNPPDRRLLVNVDFSQNKGTASLPSPPGTIKCTIIDRNMANDTSVCH